jgi:hypothetical protein
MFVIPFPTLLFVALSESGLAIAAIRWQRDRAALLAALLGILPGLLAFVPLIFSERTTATTISALSLWLMLFLPALGMMLALRHSAFRKARLPAQLVGGVFVFFVTLFAIAFIITNLP